MKYRRVWLLFLLLLICSAPAHAQQEQAVVNANESIVLDLEALSTDELIELRDQIETELVRRGVISYFNRDNLIGIMNVNTKVGKCTQQCAANLTAYFGRF